MMATLIALNGLICAAGDNRGCDTVKRSQAPDGLWWRSPKKLAELHVDPTGHESQFSKDHSLGVWAYIAQKKDVLAFRRWTDWMSKHKKFGIWPRYCLDATCDFFFSDCPMLDRLAILLDEPNSLCNPSPISSDNILAALQASFDNALGDFGSIPGAGVLEPAQQYFRSVFDTAMKPLRELNYKVEELNEKVETLARVTSNASGIITMLNAEANNPGFARHDVGYSAFLLQKYGAFNPNEVSQAAKIIAADEPENAFFEYVSNGGPTPRMLDLILAKCPAKKTDKRGFKFQWIWEREDREPDPHKPQAWQETMYWDCLFVANLYRDGPLHSLTLPAPPGFVLAYQQAEAEHKRLRGKVENIIKELRDAVKSSLKLNRPPTLEDLRIAEYLETIVSNGRGTTGLIRDFWVTSKVRAGSCPACPVRYNNVYQVPLSSLRGQINFGATTQEITHRISMNAIAE